jgi:hypothetical protein
MTQAGFPYGRPHVKCVTADVWLLHDGNEYLEAPLYLTAWDYHTKLRFRRQLQVNFESIKQESGIGIDGQLGIVVSAFSTMTWLRSEAFHTLLKEDEAQVDVHFEIGGEELGGDLRLRTALVLHRNDTSAPFTAHIPGSVLWDDLHVVRLQGDAPLFPISVVDFDRAGFASNAGWYLRFGSDLDAPLHASIRLYLNANHGPVVTAFQNAAAPRPEDQVLLRAVKADVARVMVEHALNEEDLRDEGEWDTESLGHALRSLLIRYYGGEDLAQVNERRVSHPSDFSAELFGRVGVFGGV